MFIVQIEGTSIDETQQWWQNFIDDFYENGGDGIPEKQYDKMLSKELKKYKASMILNKDSNDLDALKFEHEKYYTAFLMKWA